MWRDKLHGFVRYTPLSVVLIPYIRRQTDARVLLSSSQHVSRWRLELGFIRRNNSGGGQQIEVWRDKVHEYSYCAPLSVYFLFVCIDDAPPASWVCRTMCRCDTSIENNNLPACFWVSHVELCDSHRLAARQQQLLCRSLRDNIGRFLRVVSEWPKPLPENNEPESRWACVVR